MIKNKEKNSSMSMLTWNSQRPASTISSLEKVIFVAIRLSLCMLWFCIVRGLSDGKDKIEGQINVGVKSNKTN